MADETLTPTSGSAEDRALDALTKILESAISPDMLEAQQIILRRLALAAALVDPATGPLARAQRGGGGGPEVVARQLDATARDATSVAAEDWNAWTCDATSCSQAIVHGAYVPISPILNGAGWHQKP